MGGVGYVILLFVVAYKVAGPSLVALRVVSLAASAAAVAGITMLTLRIHGRAAALAAMALTPSLVIFRLSNTIRMDVFAIAFVAWALVLYWHATTRGQTIRSHLVVGIVFALGLEVHLHTVAAAFAVGCAYLTAWIREPHDKRGATKKLAAFVTGYAVGAVLFLALNVLPDPHAYFRTAALARLSAVESAGNLNLTASMRRHPFRRHSRYDHDSIRIARREPAIASDDADDGCAALTGICQRVHQIRADVPLPISASDREHKDRIIAGETAPFQPIDEDRVPTVVVRSRRQFGNIVRGRVRLEARDLAKVVDGMGAVRGASADTKKKETSAAGTRCCEQAGGPLNRLSIEPADDFCGLLQIALGVRHRDAFDLVSNHSVWRNPSGDPISKNRSDTSKPASWRAAMRSWCTRDRSNRSPSGYDASTAADRTDNP